MLKASFSSFFFCADFPVNTLGDASSLVLTEVGLYAAEDPLCIDNRPSPCNKQKFPLAHSFDQTFAVLRPYLVRWAKILGLVVT